MRARKLRHRLDDLAHIDKLRKRLRRQKRADLERATARAILVADPALLRRRGRKSLLQLQAISQAYLAQAHAMVGINVLNLGHASLAAVLPVGENLSPSSARTADVSAPSAGTFN